MTIKVNFVGKDKSSLRNIDGILIVVGGERVIIYIYFFITYYIFFDRGIGEHASNVQRSQFIALCKPTDIAKLPNKYSIYSSKEVLELLP